MIIQGTIENVPCEFLVDTGSNITIVRSNMLKHLGPRLSAVDSELRTANGEAIPVRGKGKFSLGSLRHTMMYGWQI